MMHCADVLAITRRLLSSSEWRRLSDAEGELVKGARDETAVSRLADADLPAFVPDLIRLEWARDETGEDATPVPLESDAPALNPTLRVLQLRWKLCEVVAEGSQGPVEQGEEWALVWRHPWTREVRVKAATPDELLSVKLIADGVPAAQAAEAGGASVAAIEAAVRRAVRQGFLIGPRSKIRRDTSAYLLGDRTPEQYTVVNRFTLQWHLTHACDLHCAHCYDRTKRGAPTLDQATAVLDDLRDFCSRRNVAGHACLTGGNPIFYPHFFEVYQGAADRGLSISILGNAVEREWVRRMVEIQKPLYYQVSLEGLPAHNDHVRGQGYFQKVMRFLEVLREFEVPSTVMLTLTRGNLDQVLPLAEMLRGKADLFTFNRLSPVGEAANLHLPTPEEYRAFLGEYVSAARENEVIGFKDNLINAVLDERGMDPFDGCSGFGCGAAFNFLCLLPDGEVHACRKFPSLLGNLNGRKIADIYDSPEAHRYRSGAEACRGCELRPVCGGCLAVASGCGKDFTRERDPFCFFARAPE
jgi:selenobiotic family peptide radical SAM maturase